MVRSISELEETSWFKTYFGKIGTRIGDLEAKKYSALKVAWLLQLTNEAIITKKKSPDGVLRWVIVGDFFTRCDLAWAEDDSAASFELMQSICTEMDWKNVRVQAEEFQEVTINYADFYIKRGGNLVEV